MVLLAQVPPSVAKADRGKAALKLNSAKIQKVLRDYVSERAHTVRPTLHCARWLTQHFLSCMQFPNQNKLVTRDQFVEVVERAIDPEDSLVDPSSVSNAKEQINHAAHELFNEKLDIIGSGMVSVRQVRSLLRFGFMEACGTPVSLSKHLFFHANQDYRNMARVYDEPAQDMPSPHGSPRAPKGLIRWPNGWQSDSNPRLQPIGDGAAAGTSRSPNRPGEAGRLEALHLTAAGGRPTTSQQGRGAVAQQKTVEDDDFGGAPQEYNENYSSDDEVDDDDDDYSSPAPWGQQDPLANAVKQQEPQPVRQMAPHQQYARPAHYTSDDSLRASASMPTLPPVQSPETILRTLNARLFRRMPGQVFGLLSSLDDGDGRVACSDLQKGLIEISSLPGEYGQPEMNVHLPEDGLRKVIASFDHLRNGTVGLREFKSALASGRMPDRAARLRARSPPKEVVAKPKKTRKKKAAAAVVAAVVGEPQQATAAAAELLKVDPPPPSAQRPADQVATHAPRSALMAGIGKAVAPGGSGRGSPGAGVATPPDGSPDARRPSSQGSAASGGSLSSLVKTMTAAHNAVQFAGIAKAAARERKQTVAAARKSARAAALLIACVNEKCKGDETCSKKEFKEAMLQLGVIGDKSDSVDELFDSIDNDGSGEITISELKDDLTEMMEPEGLDHLKELLQKGETMADAIAQLRGHLQAQAAKVVELFAQADVDGDAQISQQEFMKAMPQFGLGYVLPIEVIQLFNAFDPDGSGQISFRELHRMLKQERKKVVKVEKVVSPRIDPVDLPIVRELARNDVLKMNVEKAIEHLVEAAARRKKKDSEKEPQDAKAMMSVDEIEQEVLNKFRLNAMRRGNDIWTVGGDNA